MEETLHHVDWFRRGRSVRCQGDPGGPGWVFRTRTARFASFIFSGPNALVRRKSQSLAAYFLFFFGKRRRMIRLDMSEILEARQHGQQADRLRLRVMSASNEGGQLTESGRRAPTHVVLFDANRKAHPMCFNLFAAAVEDGRLTDSRAGRLISRTTLIIMTSEHRFSKVNRARWWVRLGFRVPGCRR